MARRVEARVGPALLIWARESAGLSLEGAAKKARAKPEHLQDWEDGISRPSIAQLRRLAQTYRRPLAIFYLAKPPKTFMPIHDFRRIDGATIGALSFGLTQEIRRAHDRREIAVELLQDLGQKLPRFSARVSREDEPEHAAAVLREFFGVRPRDQANWRGEYGPFNAWRGVFEGHGILVFQAKGIALEEMRGFSLAEEPVPVAVLNMADTPNGRVFSLAHELAHIALRRSGICDMAEFSERVPEDDAMEIFCNRVAASFLMPAEWILSDPSVTDHRGGTWSDEEIRVLARRFNVSREAFLRRLLTLGKTTPAFYKQKRQDYIKQYRERRESSEGFAPPDAVAVNRAGNFFTRLVLESYHRERITSGHVAEYLDVKLKHLRSIERASAIGGAAA